MKNLLALLVLSLLFSNLSFGQTATTPSANEDEAYTKTINSRAQKIVTTLALQDAAKADRVQAMIAGHYRNLNRLHTQRDEAVKIIKAKSEAKEATDKAVKLVEEGTAAAIKKVHGDFITTLATELTNEQITKVKDGLTYNVVNLTYAGYLDMLPNLTPEQQTQIRTWLEEAREIAMDAESSDKKHAWFGKYKGRINNYLSAAGYDLKKEGEAWQKRIKEREEKKAATN
jgi:Spy/CpxP family protein refolding chaperone